ncbi:XRE family transcriptional regulator [Halorubrum californiense DSM 19288]|uniref:XRE family transcriptional regulator n=1 Tax=Halorubrum californiense DSM 19288 TaxID=1227465 RepID=M0E5F3_9EURY|nr:CBS domain-containing protein [Halorubrum californiense]ELZ42147.1 XRE family transcriptional regulator [Halorubrum californiense DSM 19288]
MRTDTTVRDVMHREFLGVSESDSLPEAAALLVDEETNCLVVVRGGEPVGRLESRDALDALLDATGAAGASGAETDPADFTVGDAMGPPLPAVSPDDSLAAVEERLVAEGADRVVAVADGEAVGVVTDGDALAAGAPRTGAGADGFGDEGAAGDLRSKGTVLSTAAAADSDAERGAEATMDPEATRPAAGGSRDEPAGTDGDADPVAEAASGASTQGVCENCGALVPDLVTANGQAVCPNCREI